MSRSLDHATRMVIAQTIAEELRGALWLQREPVAPQLRGPCLPATEDFVIGSVLLGRVLPADVQLAAADFYVHVNSRFWESILTAVDPTDAAAIVADCFRRGRFSGPEEDFTAKLDGYKVNVDAELGLCDVATAAWAIRGRARDRRLVGLLAQLADGICAGAESFASAKLALRELFVAEARSRAI